MGRRGTRVWSPTLPQHEKARITAACERFIADTLKPRFLPQVSPTAFNDPVDILGRWHGHRYRFIQRYRSGFPDNAGEEFDAPFTRPDWTAPDRFDVLLHRDTGQWWPMFSEMSLDECFALILATPPLQPV